MSKQNEIAAAFLAQATKLGFSVSVRDTVVTISKSFTPGDIDAFSACDCFGPLLLDQAPIKGGSVWGTDGGSVGGYSAVKHGRYTLNKSGTGKRFLSALAAAVQS